jgi:protein-disulfide isomerase
MTTHSSMLTLPVSDRDHIQGSATALVTLVEYGDYECPYCGRAYPIVEELRRITGDKLRFVFRNFPLTQIHEHAEIAAESAEAAAAQGHFWEMHRPVYPPECVGYSTPGPVCRAAGTRRGAVFSGAWGT